MQRISRGGVPRHAIMLEKAEDSGPRDECLRTQRKNFRGKEFVWVKVAGNGSGRRKKKVETKKGPKGREGRVERKERKGLLHSPHVHEGVHR